jgi:hypothetical protein
VAAHRDEALGLLAITTPQHPGDRRLQVVVFPCPIALCGR